MVDLFALAMTSDITQLISYERYIITPSWEMEYPLLGIGLMQLVGSWLYEMGLIHCWLEKGTFHFRKIVVSP